MSKYGSVTLIKQIRPQWFSQLVEAPALEVILRRTGAKQQRGDRGENQQK